MNLVEATKIYKQAWEAYENDQIDNAIRLFSQIKKTSDDLKELYAKSQYILGFLFNNQKGFMEAEQAYKNVLREDHAQSYASAQLNLANLFKHRNKLEEAKQAYENVLREDRAVSYVKARLNLGCLLADFFHDKQAEAEHAYKEVGREDSKEAYAKAQFNLGNLLTKNDERLEEAEQAYKRVEREDSKEAYASAQFNLGSLLIKLNRLDEAKQAYQNIKQEDLAEAYDRAHYKLGDLEYCSKNSNLDEILKYWGNVSENSVWYLKLIYKKYLIRKILNIEKESSRKLFEIFKKVDSLLNSLIIKNKNEDLIAHYTSPSVAKLLIANNICGHYNSSKMRLNTIDLMNDPTEGEILNNFLSISSDLITTNDQAFMGCFTLHHDSLNQFRLYGKEDQKEGSGLSLILTEQFFEQENSFSNIRLQNTNSSSSEIIEFGEVDKNNKNIETSSVVESSNSKVIEKLPLYRCIYIDPDSKLIEISHREEWTFCREAKSSKSDKWENYLKDIKKLRDKVRGEFQKLEELIQPLYQKISEDIKKYSNEAELLAEILLPLRFLIKHMAFKEEQECRVVYVTQWDDEYIQYDEKLKRFYIGYGQDVVKHLKKIYLGPHAQHEKNMFEYLCSHARKKQRTEHEVKIKISHNPLR
ncbi:tetratricopeptide repeat protein [Acinetobacter sp. CE-15]|uniref:tetratricopeptide repeat protein n=1 Tax=Acinetobacter sp. CE-15 TaxID=3425693 RepID=UPI003DA67BC7